MHAPDAVPPAALSGASFAWPGGRGVAAIDLEVAAGEAVALIGPNGAGKSTVLRLASGEIEPDSGAALLFGAPPDAAARRRTGVVFQETAVDDLMRARELLELFAVVQGVPREARAERVAHALEAAGLQERGNDRCGALSGGLRRRLDLQRALLHEPDLIVLDEPSLGLDLDSSRAVRERLRAARGAGAAILLATNDVEEAEALADRVGFILNGEMLALDAPSALTRDLRRESVILEWAGADAAESATVAAAAGEMAAWDGVGAVRAAGGELHATVDSASAFLAAAFERCGGSISGVRIRPSSLADAWFHLAGSPLEREQPE